MSTPACPIFRAAIITRYGTNNADNEGACIGSRCAWWVRDANDSAIGSCGLGNGQQFTNPAMSAAHFEEAPPSTRTSAERAPAVPRPVGGVDVGQRIKFLGDVQPHAILRVSDRVAYTEHKNIMIDMLDWNELEARWDEEIPF